MKKGRINAYFWLVSVLLIMYIFFVNGKKIWDSHSSSQSQENSMISGFFSKNYLSNLEQLSFVQSTMEYEGMEEGIVNYEDEDVVETIQGDNGDNIGDINNSANADKISRLFDNPDYDYLKSTFYIVDSATSVTPQILNPQKLTTNDVTIKKDSKKPQILIYHTHSTEKYIDSQAGNEDDTVVGVGNYLEQLLTDAGYNVLHDKNTYDVVDGKWNRNAYETALTDLQQILKDNPSIKVAIDLHRNAGNNKITTTIDGVECAQIMFFNGVSRTRTGNRNYLSNENLEMNLSFSLQLLLEAMRQYDDFAKHIYIKGYRYNLHLLPRSMLIEVGNDKNTIEEAKNAMLPFSKILISVLEGEE